MISVTASLVFDMLCLGLSIVFFWSTFVVMIGLIRPAKRHPRAERKLKFAVLVCAQRGACHPPAGQEHPHEQVSVRLSRTDRPC